MGDFNVNILNFETHSLTNDYISSLISKSFIPLITLPTRIKHQSATLIDHIFTNNVCQQYHAGIIINSLSDHFPVFYIENVKQPINQLPDKITRKINPNTIPAFCKLIQSTKWTSVIGETNPKIAFDNFFETPYYNYLLLLISQSIKFAFAFPTYPIIIFNCPFLIFASISLYSLQTTATVFIESV